MPDTLALDLTRPARLAAPGGPEGWLAVRLLEWAREAGPRGLVHVARSEGRAERLARILHGLAPAIEVLVLPPWDCLPYDRAPPSREVMGRRIATLRRIAGGHRPVPRVLITTIDAAMQRLPPRIIWAAAGLSLGVGDGLRIDELDAHLRRTGYVLDDRVDEPGEAAIRGEVIDLFPAGDETPCRIDHAEGRIVGLRRYDPVTQRTLTDIDRLRVEPASEAIVADPAERFPGIEHWLPGVYERLETVFDYLPEDAPVVLDPEVDERRAAFLDQIADAHESRLATRWIESEEHAPPRQPLAPDRLYLAEREWERRLRSRAVIALGEPDASADRSTPRFAAAEDAEDAFGRFLEERLAAGSRVVLAAASDTDLKRFAAAAARHVDDRLDPLDDWDAALAAPPGTVGLLRADLTSGFVHRGVAVVAYADLAGVRARAPGEHHPSSVLPLGGIALRPGDAVIHVDHGMGVLRGLEVVEVGGVASEVVKLEYAGEATLLAPIEEIDRLRRYGTEASAVTLDRLDGAGWAKRRAEVEAQVAETARALVELARAREAASAPVLRPARREYARFVARFPFAETHDQAAAIEATLRDLASGKPMDRLVCGDVGFGKTEVALRAAAATAFAGKQVAVIAPTTVLARQHLATFRRRFAGLGVRIEPLSRLTTPAEAKAVKAGLADGGVRIAVGTHALAGKGVRFEDLGLLVIDEEQRFGTKQKAMLRERGRGVHVLTLTATPIPRTLQAATVGLQELSVIATPPARRQPIRTFLLPFDPVTVREALRRERRRGGQSFVVCPRVEDIEGMTCRLRELVPELEVLTAHGKMPAAELDEAMVRFADGEGDVLLSTNIVETGLDVPGANTMLVWRADRFGLAQLHQLRGRVGRGRRRGVAYLLTDPAVTVAPATERRLKALESLDRLGAGFAISARDLDLRGAGDLIGEKQAGHMKRVGVELYQDLLQRALLLARGERPPEDWTPEIHLGLPAGIPAAYVPEEEVRLQLYARLARLREAGEIDAFAAEIEDRFGAPPEETHQLLALARLARACRRLGVAKLEAGPQAIAFTFRGDTSKRGLDEADERLEWHGGRLILHRATGTAEERLRAVEGLLRSMSAILRRRRSPR